MKILFLDVDGVLNHTGSRSRFAISRPAARRLRRVLRETDAKVVLSSTWRLIPEAREKFVQRTGIRPIGLTPVGNTVRGDEIQAWLDGTLNVARYAIVDDDNDMLPSQLPFFVQTSWFTGLLDEHAEQLIGILNS